MPHPITIRPVKPEDAPALAAIYAPYVAKTAISFEYKIPTSEEFRRRISRTLEHYPYLVAELDGEVIGYCYVGPFVGRIAYDWAVETSIYLRMDKKGLGAGKALYLAMEDTLRERGFLSMEACVAYLEEEDEYLTNASVHFHEKMGYRMVGRFEKCGYKFGRWYDMVWLEKHIAPHEKGSWPAVTPLGRSE